MKRAYKKVGKDNTIRVSPKEIVFNKRNWIDSAPDRNY